MLGDGTYGARGTSAHHTSMSYCQPPVDGTGDEDPPVSVSIRLVRYAAPLAYAKLLDRTVQVSEQCDSRHDV
jgi:hypothetical protein